MAVPDRQAEVVDFRTARDEKRERECKYQLRGMGLPMRGMGLEESFLVKLEVMEWDLEHWSRKARTAQYLNGRMLAILREANARHAASEALLADALAELERLRALLK